MEKGLIIINKSGFMGSRKPCTNCGSKDCKKKGTQNNGEDENSLEPMYPIGIQEAEEQEEDEDNESDLEPMLPASARAVKY